MGGAVMEKLVAQVTFLIKRPARLSFYANHSRHPYQFRVFLLISASLLMSGNNAGATDAPRSQREAAVIAARNGDTQAGLVALEALLLKYPDDPRLLADTTIVANWAGNDQLALDLYGRV